MKSHKATKDEQKWMDRITELGCCICLREFRVHTPPEIHHISGKTRVGSHFHTIPLCYRHHRGGGDNDHYTSRHPHKFQFEKRYGTEQKLFEWTREQLDAGHG